MTAFFRAPVRLQRGLVYTAALLRALTNARQRALVREALTLARQLPQRLEQPLPEALAGLTPPVVPQPLPETTIRQIVDALTAFGAGRPLGICLRRSLLRYYFLRRAGLPLVIHFGARRQGDAIGGHAWLTRQDQPYHEQPQNILTHTEMWRFPTT
ncbi:MAG: lasso peptide biosynthesis B2 protein [Anaerolineae bacterium]